MTDLARLIMTNDDGIDSPGLLLFAKELAKEFDVVVAASTSMSGAGTSIGRFDPETGVELNTVEMDGFTAHTIAGPPGLAVMAQRWGRLAGSRIWSCLASTPGSTPVIR